MFAELYAAYNARLIDDVVARLHPNVEWPNAREGGYVRGRDAVRQYWLQMWQEIDPQVIPMDVTLAPDGRLVVLVQQVVHDLKGNALSYTTLEHVYRQRDGLFVHMEIRPVASA
jgi:hypothetical protein